MRFNVLSTIFFESNGDIFLFKVSNGLFILGDSRLFRKSEKEHVPEIRHFDNDKTFFNGTSMTLMAMDRSSPVKVLFDRFEYVFCITLYKSKIFLKNSRDSKIKS